MIGPRQTVQMVKFRYMSWRASARHVRALGGSNVERGGRGPAGGAQRIAKSMALACIEGKNANHPSAVCAGGWYVMMITVGEVIAAYVVMPRYGELGSIKWRRGGG